MNMENNYLLQHLLRKPLRERAESPAVTDEQGTVTFAELDSYGAALAKRLFDSGFRPRDAAGVFLHKSAVAIVSFLGILKSGGAYIPLDPLYSSIARIRKIIHLSGIKYIITDAEHWDALARGGDGNDPLNGLNVILTDSLDHMRERGAADAGDYRNDQSITDDDLAYILYTSGSTGEPKGVMISHLNALTFIKWALTYFNPEAGNIFANHAPFHFDLSVFDIYVSIASGGHLKIVPEKTMSNPRALVKWMEENRIQYWYSVPSVWINIQNYADIEEYNLSAVKKILFAGEVFPPKYLRNLMGRIPGASYYNLYGPTETNVVTYYRVAGMEDVGEKPVPIGFSCENMEVIVLNDQGMLAADGEEGELCVKGSCVTKGYYKNPEGTRNAFSPSTLAYHGGAPLYHTGDRVRRNKDNCHEYIGRKDFMVKCSGFRIELPEIERVLNEDIRVEEAVVVAARCDDKTSIGAFIKPKPQEKISIVDVKNTLARKLTKYMVPETIKIVESIPRNSNGKANRKLFESLLADEFGNS